MALGTLEITLSLAVDGTSYDVPGGQVKALDLTLDSWGFSGRVSFVLFDDSSHGGSFTDELVTVFTGTTLMTASLSLQWKSFDGETSDDPTALSLSAIATGQRFAEVLYRHLDDVPILARRYDIEFTDAAQALWRQHQPCKLYTETSVSDILGEHASSHFTIDCQVSDFSEQQDLFFVHLPDNRDASFYDFVMWYLDSQNAIWQYDYANNKYLILSEKDTSSTAVQLLFEDVAAVEVSCPPVPRYKPRVLNSYADNATSQEVDNTDAAASIYRDTLVRTQVSQDVDDRVTLETSRLHVPLYRAEVEFRRGPLADFLAPGTLVEMATANRWSSESALVGKTWRVVRSRLAATVAEKDRLQTDSQQSEKGLEGSLVLSLEQSDDTCHAYPSYHRPHYPGFIEGKIVSAQGEDTDITYDIDTDTDTSIEYYKVEVPLWEDKQVLCPFEPCQGSGDVFIPAYRDQRVLMAVELTGARIHWLLDWRDGAPMSMDVQGEQIYFGKTSASRTVVNHQYEDDDPVFLIERLHDSDTSYIRLEEGAFILEVKEDSDG